MSRNRVDVLAFYGVWYCDCSLVGRSDDFSCKVAHGSDGMLVTELYRLGNTSVCRLPVR